VLSTPEATVHRTRWRRLAIILLVVVALLVVLDRIALLVAERAGARTVQQS
jgi:cytochrome c oxidase subunit IV